MALVGSTIAGLRTENSGRPAVSLPTELLSQIFESTCHIVISTRTDPSVVDHTIASRWRVQNAILATCSRWREVGLTTSSLWESVLVANPNYLAADKVSGRIPMMTGIERAGTRPLSLYVSSTLDAYNWDKICTLLGPHIHRFRQIFASQTSYPRQFGLLTDLSSHEGSLPLQTLVLTWRQARPPQAENIDLTRATTLRRLQLRIMYQHGPLVTIRPPPSSELTHIRLPAKIDPSDAIRIIESTKCLQVLGWSFLGEQTPSIDSIKSQPYLRYLSIVGALPTRLLVGLEAPRLETLQIDLHNASLSGISHIALRAFPKLRTLHLSSGGLARGWENSPHRATLQSVLSACQQLEQITLSYILDDQLVTFLASDALPPKIKDVWVFVDDNVHRTARELLHRWTIQEGRKDTVLHIQGNPGREAVVDGLVRDLVPTYGERVTVGDARSEYDRVWTVETCM